MASRSPGRSRLVPVRPWSTYTRSGATHAQLVERGVEVGEIQSVDGDVNKVRQGGTALDNVGFLFFRDPDGNGWAVQQISARV